MRKPVVGLGIVVGFLGLLLGTYLLRTVSDPDLWWHIVIGKWIVAHRTVPWFDYWNAFGVNKPWFAYSWSFEVLFATIDRFWGLVGLQVAQCIFGLILSFSLLGAFIVLSRSLVIGSMIGAVAVSATYPYFFLRPQVLSWMLLVMLILIGERIRQDGISRGRLLLVALAMALWANTNITSVIGLALVCAWVINLESLSGLVESLLVAVKVGLAGFVGSLFTPYYGSEWLMAGQTFYHPWLYSNIIEFMPLSLYNFQAGMLLLEIVLLGFFLHCQPKGVAPSHLVIVVGVAGLGVCVSKFCPHAVLVVSAVLSITWARYAGTPTALGNIGVGLSMLESRGYAISRGMVITSSFILALGCVKNIGVAYTEGNYAFAVTPVRALDFVTEHDLPLPVTATFGAGGYVLYRFSDAMGVPKFRVPIDGRTNVNDPKIARLHTEALGGSREWNDFLQETKGETIVWPNESALVSLLTLSEEWCSVFDESKEAPIDPQIRHGQPIPSSYGQSVFVRRSYFEAHRDILSSGDCK